MESPQFAIGVSHGIESGNRFLAEVTAFVERDTLFRSRHFLREIFLGDVATILGVSRFNP